MSSAFPGGLDNLLTNHLGNDLSIGHAALHNLIADAINQLEQQQIGAVYNVMGDGGAVANGNAADTSTRIQSVYDAAPDGSTVVIPRGPFNIATGINPYGSDPANPKTIKTRGAGFYDGYGLKCAAGFTGPAINIAPTAAGQRTGYEVRDLYIDQTLANTTAEGIYLDKVQQTLLKDVKIRGGKTGTKTAFANINRFNRVICFNQSDAGMRWITQYGDLTTVPESVDHKLFQCLVYQTSGATTDMNAAYEIQSGNDFQMVMCHGLRAVGTSRKMLDGLFVNFAASKNLYLFMLNCELDGISDLTVNGQTHAAARFVNAINARIVNSWFSATDGSNYMCGVLIDGGDQLSFVNNWISGSGVWWTTAANPRTDVIDCDFPNFGGGSCFNFPASGGPTTFVQDLNRYQTGTLANDMTKIVSTAPPSNSFPTIKSPYTILTDDVDGFHGLRLQNASTGFGKTIRISRAATGKTLEFMADNGTTRLLSLSDGGQPIFHAGGIVTAISTGSGTTISPNAANGNWLTQTITTNGAITVNAPTGPPASSQHQRLVIEILNSSGGALGAITPNAIYKMAGITWTLPANTFRRAAYFDWNGVNWVCQGVSPADY